MHRWNMVSPGPFLLASIPVWPSVGNACALADEEVSQAECPFQSLRNGLCVAGEIDR